MNSAIHDENAESLNPLEQGNLSDIHSSNLKMVVGGLNPLEQGNLSDALADITFEMVFASLNPLEQGNLSDSTPLEPA